MEHGESFIRPSVELEKAEDLLAEIQSDIEELKKVIDKTKSSITAEEERLKNLLAEKEEPGEGLPESISDAINKLVELKLELTKDPTNKELQAQIELVHDNLSIDADLAHNNKMYLFTEISQTESEIRQLNRHLKWAESHLLSVQKLERRVSESLKILRTSVERFKNNYESKN